MTAFVSSWKAASTTTRLPSNAATRSPNIAFSSADSWPSSWPLAAAVSPLRSALMSVGDVHVETTTTLPSGAAFEPILPDSTTLLAFGSIVLLSALAVWVWAKQVVPVSRTNLALSKKIGPVKEYLDELRAAGEVGQTSTAPSAMDATTTKRPGEKQKFVDGDATQTDDATTVTLTSEESTELVPSKDTRALERWLFADWLQKEGNTKPGRQKEPALPVLKKAKWNSGDNPVLVASALILAGVLFTALTERIAGVGF